MARFDLWRQALALAASGLLLAAGPHPSGDPAGAQAHAQGMVEAEMVGMGADAVEFHHMQAVPLPRPDGAPGLAVCGTAWDTDPDPDGDLWGFHFIAFYEWADGWAAPVGNPVYVRMEPRAPTATDLCAGARDTAQRRLPLAGQPVAGAAQ